MSESEKFVNAEEFRHILSSSIGLRLRSDVPVGVCLSGGLDSSSIVSILLKYYNKTDLKTFSAVYEKGQTGDETEYIKEFSLFLKNMYYITPNAQTLLSDMEDF
ncbi:MAG TPA: asparagine synthase-related protein [Bacteroidales bacterium]|nr:asparagine synthase-related protein [Bacteroidales bacterium]